MLQPSLSGDARISVICTINPSKEAITESSSTLLFAQRIKRVQVCGTNKIHYWPHADSFRYSFTPTRMKLSTQTHSWNATAKKSKSSRNVLPSVKPTLRQGNRVAASLHVSSWTSRRRCETSIPGFNN